MNYCVGDELFLSDKQGSVILRVVPHISNRTNADLARAMNDEKLAEFAIMSSKFFCTKNITKFVKSRWAVRNVPLTGSSSPRPRRGSKMYEELIQALQLHCETGKKIGLNGKIWTLLGDASTALEALTAQLSALQVENAEKDKEIKRLNFMMESAKNVAIKRGRELSRVEAERDALLEYANAQMECEMCKNDTFCPMENPMPENCALCELKPKCPCHPCKWEWRGAQGEG